MADCDKYIELISAALDGACSPAERTELEAHLAACPQCKAFYDDLKTIHDTLSTLPAMDPPADLKDRVMAAIEADNVVPLPVKKKPIPWRRWGATAAAALLVAIGVWGLDWGGVSPDKVSGPAPDAASPSPAMFRSAALPRPSGDPTAGVEGYSVTNGLEGADQAAEALPSSEAPESQEAPDENQALPASDKTTSMTDPTPMPSPAANPKRFSSTAPASGVTVPAVDAASGEEAEPTPVPEPNIALFTALPPSNSAPALSEAPGLTVGEALELLLAEKGFEEYGDYEKMDDLFVIWPREESFRASLVYDTISENGKYYIFGLYHNVYDSAEDDLPSHNSRCGAYAVALDGSEILEEGGPEFWDALSKE